jgi:hypothetical protein
VLGTLADTTLGEPPRSTEMHAVQARLGIITWRSKALVGAIRVILPENHCSIDCSISPPVVAAGRTVAFLADTAAEVHPTRRSGSNNIIAGSQDPALSRLLTGFSSWISPGLSALARHLAPHSPAQEASTSFDPNAIDARRPAILCYRQPT